MLMKLIIVLCLSVIIVHSLPINKKGLLDIQIKDNVYPLPKSFSGVYEANKKLSQTLKLHNHNITGPESLAIFNGRIVASAMDGYIYEINDDLLKPILKIAEQSCHEIQPKENIRCSRPLGMKFDSKGVLYVVEPYLGVFAIENIFKDNPKVTLVFDIEETRSLGKVSTFLDDLTIDEGAGASGGHVLYVSDVSQKFYLHNFVWTIMTSDLGRVVSYDVNAKKVESVVQNLFFPNGMEITDDRTAILINEFGARQVIKHYIKGPKKGESKILLSGLPGEPDNIRRSDNKDKETYWLALLSARTEENPSTLDLFLRDRDFRRQLTQLLTIANRIFNFFGDFFDNKWFHDLAAYINNDIPIHHIWFDETLNYGMIVEIDGNGDIIRTLQAPDSSLTKLTEVREIRINSGKQSILYIGSFINDYLGKLVIEN